MVRLKWVKHRQSVNNVNQCVSHFLHLSGIRADQVLISTKMVDASSLFLFEELITVTWWPMALAIFIPMCPNPPSPTIPPLNPLCFSVDCKLSLLHTIVVLPVLGPSHLVYSPQTYKLKEIGSTVLVFWHTHSFLVLQERKRVFFLYYLFIILLFERSMVQCELLLVYNQRRSRGGGGGVGEFPPGPPKKNCFDFWYYHFYFQFLRWEQLLGFFFF